VAWQLPTVGHGDELRDHGRRVLRWYRDGVRVAREDADSHGRRYSERGQAANGELLVRRI
jgi:hypothetical protein